MGTLTFGLVSPTSTTSLSTRLFNMYDFTHWNPMTAWFVGKDTVIDMSSFGSFASHHRFVAVTFALLITWPAMIHGAINKAIISPRIVIIQRFRLPREPLAIDDIVGRFIHVII